MKSTFLKAVKVVALSLVLSVGASSLVFANGGGNGAGGSTTWTKKNKSKRRVAKRIVKRRTKTAQHSTH